MTPHTVEDIFHRIIHSLWKTPGDKSNTAKIAKCRIFVIRLSYKCHDFDICVMGWQKNEYIFIKT